jgi:hypothetical protein
MFRLGISITDSEHELLQGLTDLKQSLDYMNWRLVKATLHAIRTGMPVSELVQFSY